MTEDQLIKQFFDTAQCPEHVAVGIGDDAAVINIAPGHQLVISVDTLLEDVHFPKDFSPQDLATRAIAVS